MIEVAVVLCLPKVVNASWISSFRSQAFIPQPRCEVERACDFPLVAELDRLQPLALCPQVLKTRHWGAPWIAIFLALLFYVIGLGSDHLATNGDELVYAQMTKLTAASGQFLPLQTADETLRNTKPPLLFWQGILSTGWGRDWSLSRLRGPSVLYTFLTGGLLVLLGARRLRSLPLGLSAAALFLCFFTTYRYGRVFLTSAPETFFLFAPLALLLLHGSEVLPRGGLQPLLFGLMVGLALLYKSFALVIPFVATIALWDLMGRKWQWRPFLIEDAWKIVLIAVAAMLTFGLWFFLDPHPWQVFTDFVLRENVGKLSSEQRKLPPEFSLGNVELLEDSWFLIPSTPGCWLHPSSPWPPMRGCGESSSIPWKFCSGSGSSCSRHFSAFRTSVTSAT
jgi:4-amino-4-deoxy-L-arabinose transferase-like glycosyltransferase